MTDSLRFLSDTRERRRGMKDETIESYPHSTSSETEIWRAARMGQIWHHNIVILQSSLSSKHHAILRSMQLPKFLPRGF